MRIVSNSCFLTLIFKNYDTFSFIHLIALFFFYSHVCFNLQPDSTAAERAVARLAMHPLLKKKIDVLKGLY